MNTIRGFAGVCILMGLILMSGCQDKNAACATITVSPNGDKHAHVPGVAEMSVNPNTPHGRGWEPKGSNQTVLAFEVFNGGDGCLYRNTPNVISLNMEVDVAISPFVVGRSFEIVSPGIGDDDDTVYAKGTVTNDGKINGKFWTPYYVGYTGGPTYFTLQLDTSGAQPGDHLAVTSGSVDYEIDEKEYRSYELPYTPPPLEY